jgi:hypothetical protein
MANPDPLASTFKAYSARWRREGPRAFTGLERSRLHAFFRLSGRPTPRALIMGGCIGRAMAELSDEGCFVAGMDATTEALAHARRAFPPALLIRSDLRLMPFARSAWDAIWLDGVFNHIPRAQQRSCLIRVRDTLRAGGVLALGLATGEGESLEGRGPEGVLVVRRTLTECAELFASLDFDLRHEETGEGEPFVVYRREY